MKKKKNLTYLQLVRIAADAYPDRWPLNSVTHSGEFIPNRATGGDGLAHFIAAELHGTYDPEASVEVQLNEAIRVMQKAAAEV